jgi:ubiquinone/menaquinone biosynthesis C-methylase UbiE
MADRNKFNAKKLKRLNDPRRLIDIPPAYLCDKLDIGKPKVLVEIGAGTAFFSVALLGRMHPSTVYACDISETMIDWVNENVRPNHPAIIPVKSEEHTVPLDDMIADLVFMINLHHELDDPSRTIGESFRLLRAGGAVIVVDWKKKAMPEGPPVEIRCLPEHVRDELIESGFSGVNIDNGLPKHFIVVGKKIDQPA